MKVITFSLIYALFFTGCQKAQEEEVVDLDRMVIVDSDVNQHLAGEPLETPQEVFTDEADVFE